MKEFCIKKTIRKSSIQLGLLLSTLFFGRLQAQDPFDVLHYRFDLTFPLESSAFSGTVTLTCAALGTLDKMTLEMSGLTVDSIRMNQMEVGYSRQDDSLFLSLPIQVHAEEQFSLSVAYHGAPDEIGFIFYEHSAYTMAEPEDARYWFPGHDVPWDKATAELHVTVPKGVEVASIGLLKDRAVSQDGAWETFFWQTDYPVSTYLICVTMSDNYTVWSDWYVTASGDSIEMPYYVFSEDAEKSPVDVENLPAAMDFFSRTFGEFPFEKYGTATVTKAWFGGMEHQTMTTVVQKWWQGNKNYEGGFVHELAHMWWGDAVTLNDWPAIWLNEGFASYSELLFREYFYGQENMRAALRERRQSYLNQTREYDFPVYNPPRESLFNWAIVYLKGAWILHMLRHVTGDEVFKEILSDYYETFKYGNASIPDFQSVCERHHGASLGWFFNEWVYGEGYVRLAYNWENRPLNNGDYLILLNIKQDDPPYFKMPVDVRLMTNTGAVDTTLWIQNSSEIYHLKTQTQVREIIFDPDDWLIMTDTLMQALPIVEEAGGLQLFSGYPNPFQESVVLTYTLPEDASDRAVLEVVDLAGRRVCSLRGLAMTNLRYEAVWDGVADDGRPVSSGVYFAVLHFENQRCVRKIIRIR